MDLLETIKQRVGGRVRDLRKAAGFPNAEKLAEAIGVSANTVYEIERGENWVSPEMAEKLAVALKVSVGTIFEIDSVRPKPTIQEALEIISKNIGRLAALSPAQRALFDILPTIDDEQAERFVRLAGVGAEARKEAAALKSALSKGRETG